MKLVEITVSGGISKEEIEKVVKANIQSIQDCIAKTGLGGNVVIKLTIRKDGTVKSISILSSNLKNKSASRCIAKPAKTWQFPAAAQETSATVMLTVRS